MLSSISYPTILPWCFNLLLIYSLSTLSTASLINTNETDRVALLAIKAQLHDPLGVTSSWNNSVPFCLWIGVSCGRRHQRVTNLDLRNQSIGGHLSPFIGNLSFLRAIHLEDNLFNGEIPHEVGRLFRLETLILANNSFSGTIPTNLSHCSNLVVFHACGNKFVGEIPAEIGNLLQLEILSFGLNYLTGEVPASMGNLSALRELNLGFNNLGGRIPDALGQLRGLVHVSFALNLFSGMVPDSIYNLSSIKYFFLTSNRLHGSLPFNIGFTLPNLVRFVIPRNNFTGSLPVSITNASNLEELDISTNNFRGKVSFDFSVLTNLTKINLGENNFGMGTSGDLEFVTSLVNCSRLKALDLYKNQFGGMLPHSVANLSTTMTKLAIGSNQIFGTIPLGIENLVRLTGLGLEYNQLTGTIPPTIGQLKNLQILFLNYNKLQGSIPNSLGNLTILWKLALESNNLEGNIPSSLEHCQSLAMLSVYKNKLVGTVPQQIFGITTLSIRLDMSHNLLSGPFPSEVGSLKNLVKLDISKNKFSREIPVSLGSCTSLEYLNLQGNSFSGNIPPSLRSLKSIKYIDFSSNTFSGQIPKYFENLSFLEYLNLSYNDFEGEVPTKGVFSNATRVSLAGNVKLCGGLPEFHLPSCHFKRPKKSHINLRKVLIPVIVSSLILLSTFSIIVIISRRRKHKKESSIMFHAEERFPMVSYAELSKATNEFSPSNMIGQGGYGSVYKGILGENRMIVAVKVINLQRKGASKSFMAECQALRKIRHRNLNKIITLCSSIDFKGADFKALVYEYMQNGSLEEWLHQSEDQVNLSNLSLIHRLNIAIDMASAIEYLHHHCQPPIVHGDLKPSNVLLDHDMVAHVGDFGLARFLSENQIRTESKTKSSSIGIKGTVGYVAPEYGMGNQVSMSGDVYSFGIFLLEMFTGKRPTDSMFHDELTLHDFTNMSLLERVMEIAEPSLLLEATIDNNNVENFVRLHGEGRVRMEDCLVGVLRIGVLCSMESPVDRMEMTDVVAKLCAIRENFLNRRTGDVRPSSQ